MQPLLTVKETATAYGIPQPTLYKWLATGRLTKRKVYGVLVIATNELKK